MLDDDLKTILPATRNYKYAIAISPVKTPGYPDPDTASESADARIEYEVIEWNQKDERELVFDGPFYISIESKKVYLYKPEGSSDDLEMTTNIATEDLNIEFMDSHNGTPNASADGYTIWNDRFKVELVFDTNNKIKAVRFTALQPYDVTGSSSNLDAIRIYSKRVTVEIDIEQLNESPDQWIDGGNIEIDIEDK
ncbi:MAG: hypothetical protein LIP01_00880 [Tannerellaceae bacterium]|nr:hypothetical protein [Tannerellaceae bacterium]